MDLNGHGDVLVFYVNGKRVAEPHPDPEANLLQYLRRTCLPGTKEGCGHGGCGSCTVMVSKYDLTTKRVLHYSVNACLFPLCAAHGLAITTVEGVGSPKTGLHVVQKRLVESHGLQCGFCTPGFVMSAFTLLRNNPYPSRDDVERALEGNLCRCTGYRPILDAFSSFTQEACQMGENCCRNEKKENSKQEIDPSAEKFCWDGDTQVPIFPSELHLPNDYNTKFVHFCGGNDIKWYRPTTEAGLVSLKDKFPDAPIIMGNTTVAQYMRQGKFTSVIYGASIADLKTVEATKKGIVFGAAVTLSELYGQLKTLCVKLEEHRRRHFPSLMSMVERYGSDQIRNVATLGGSIQSGRSNSDVITLLTALNASVTVNSVKGARTVPLEDLSLKNNEVIWHITIPYTERTDVFEFYKQADRRTFSLAIINSGMFVRLNGKKVKAMRLSFGGVAQTTVLAPKTAKKAIGKTLDEALLHKLIPLLAEDLVNGNKPRDGTYKVSVATAFLYKFYTSVCKLLMNGNDNTNILKEVPMPPSSGTQFYHPCTLDDQPESDAVGRPVPNVSSEAIVSGEAIYTDDIPSMQGELFMSLVISSKAHAKLIRVDTSEALKVEGVHSYIDHTDIPGSKAFGMIKDEEFFATKEVIYVGQPVGAILADTRETAHRAAKLVKIEYEDLAVILTLEEAIKAESYIGDTFKMDNGDVDEGLKGSGHIIEGECGTGSQEHFYMETQSVLVIPKIENDEFEVFCPTQALTNVQEAVSQVLNVPRNKIVCKTKRIGGAFGGKEMRMNLTVGPAAIAAYKTKRPIRSVLRRETDMLITGKRHPFLARYKIGVEKDGSIKALDIQMYCNAGSTWDFSIFVIFIAGIGIENCYNIPNIRVRGYTCKTNIPSNTAFRGFGKPQATAIIEEIMFKVACNLKLTQEQIRERNLIKPGHIAATGTEQTNCTINELWKQCMESSEFEKRRKEIDEFNRTSRWTKRGMSMTTTAFGVGVGMMISVNQGAALVNIYLDGSVLVSHGGIEMGQGLHTKLNQVASRALGVPMEKIYTSEVSTSTVPNTVVSGGSTTTDLYAPAVLDACTTLIDRLKPVREKHPNASWEELIEKAFSERVQLSATGFYKHDMKEEFNLEKKTGKTNNYFTYGVACSEVEIDVLTGENQVLRADIVFDVGRSLNPAIDIGQIEGGFVQGMGMMTSEFTEADENGRMMNCSPLSYKIPNVRSIPRQFNVTLLKNYNFKTVIYSSKGIGEPPYMGSISVIQAIKDAVKAARAEVGLQGYFRLDSPATVQRIREVCGNQLKK